MAKTIEATTRVVVATTTFHGPEGVLVIEGTLWDAAHPVVKTHPTMFRPVEDVANRA